MILQKIVKSFECSCGAGSAAEYEHSGDNFFGLTEKRLKDIYNVATRNLDAQYQYEKIYGWVYPMWKELNCVAASSGRSF